MQIAHVEKGSSPLLINCPHVGVFVPEKIMAHLSDAAALLPDTDWKIDELYLFARVLGAGLMTATHSRYVVDLNRPPDDGVLYESGGSGLVPLQTFEGKSVYQPGQAPSASEIANRVDRYWAPYHALLRTELGRLRRIFGWAILLDAHSIVGRLPLLFEGQLPDLNLGTNDGASVPADLESGAFEILTRSAYPAVLNQRFKGGFITRHYGQPETGIYALQLEMSQRVYMSGTPSKFDAKLAAAVQPLLRKLVELLLRFRHSPTAVCG